MDDDRFDGILRALGSGATRRGLLGLLAAVGVAPATPDEVAGRHTHRHRRRQHRRRRRQRQRLQRRGGCELAQSYNPATRQPDLSGQFLLGCDLRFANLRGANLRQTNLALADLRDATLAFTFLSRADVRHASLDRAILTTAFLDRTILRNAVLDAADLSDTTMALTDLDGAWLRNANLFGARGMDTAVLTGVFWSNTTCPDGTNSDNNGGTCFGHLTPA